MDPNRLNTRDISIEINIDKQSQALGLQALVEHLKPVWHILVPYSLLSVLWLGLGSNGKWWCRFDTMCTSAAVP